MTTRDALVKGIEPGSLPHGDRATLEAGLSAALPQPSGNNPTGGVGGVAPPPDAAGDPLAALLNGDVTPSETSDPVTQGLSVGMGDGPGGPSLQVTPEQAKLQQIAMQAKSPLIRQMARNELRRIVREAV